MNKYFFSGLAFLSTANLHAASVTSVDFLETPSENPYYTVAITGSGFGGAPNIVVFDDFDNQTSASVELNKALIGQWNTGSSFSSAPKVVDFDGGKAIAVNTPGTYTAKISQIEALFPERVSSVFISYSVTVPEGRFFAGSTSDLTFPTGSSWKYTWILDGPNGVDGLTKYNVCAPSHVGRGNFMLVGNSVSYGYFNMAPSWSWHTKNYMGFGVMPHETQPQTQNGHLIFQLTGKKDRALIVNKLDKPIFPVTNSTSFDRVQFPGWFGNGDFTNFQAYYDDIYVATGRNAYARVELSDSLDIATSTINLTMPVVSWSDTEIIFKLSKNTYKKASQFYLRIYDRNNSSSAHNLPCGECPEPPTI